jgi:hypothetical protein
MSLTMQNAAAGDALPFSPASFPRVANAAARQLGRLIGFAPPRFRRRGGFIVGKSNINSNRSAVVWVTAISKVAPAFCLEIGCAPTPEATAIGMQAWRIAIEVINTQATAEQKTAAFEAMTTGIKPGGTFDLDFDGIAYRLNWIAEIALQLVATRVNN